MQIAYLDPQRKRTERQDEGLRKAMFYFHMAPRDYRKIFVVERSVHPGRNESLLSYFLRTHAHMIPPDVELWELDSEGDELVVHEAGA